MKKKAFTARLGLIPVVLAFAASVQAGLSAEKPTIIVARTEASQIAGWQPAIGEGLAQMIVTELTKLGKFEVLESLALPDLEGEQDLGKEGKVKESEKVQTGEWEGADYILITKVTAFGDEKSGWGVDASLPPGPDPWARPLGHPHRPVAHPAPAHHAPAAKPKGPRGPPGFPGIPGLGRGIGPIGGSKVENKITIVWRIVDIASRKIKTAGTAEGIEKGSSFNIGGFNWGSSQSSGSALGKATKKAVAQIIAEIQTVDLPVGDRVALQEKKAAAQQEQVDQEYWKLRSVRGAVTAVKGKTVYMSLNNTQGFAKGDKVKVYKTTEVTNKDGKVIATEYQEVGVVELSSVTAEMCKGDYSGAGKIEEGYAVADERLNIEEIK